MSAPTTPSKKPEAPKPWHNKAPAGSAPQHEVKLEIFESKRKASERPSSNEEKEQAYVVLSCDGVDITVPEHIARISGLVCSILDSAGDYIEKQTRHINFETITAPVLEEVIKFCFQELKENPTFARPPSLPPSPLASTTPSDAPLDGGSPSKQPEAKDEVVALPTKRTAFVFELKPDMVMELVTAAEYLQIPSLLSHVVYMLAAYADDVPSFAGMSESLIQQVCYKCKPDALRKIELDRKLETYGETFSTTPIWKLWCKDWEEFVVNNQQDYNTKTRLYAQYIAEEANNNNPNNNNNEPAQQNDEIDWRRGYAELTLEKMLYKIMPDEERKADLQAFASLFGDLVQSLRLDLRYHWYIEPALIHAWFPNIKFLEIVGEVGAHTDGLCAMLGALKNLSYIKVNCSTVPNNNFWHLFCSTLENIPSLRELDLSGNSMKAYGARCVATMLRQNQSLVVLNLSGNPLELEGLMEVASSLFQTRVKVLDVSDCGIVTNPHSEQVLHSVTPVTHRLKVLKISGNNFEKRSGSFWKYMLSGCSLEYVEIARGMSVQRDKDIRLLVGYLAELPKLTYLDLSENHMEELAMESISFSLLLNQRVLLKTLVLSGNSVNDKSAAILAQALRYNSCLNTLVLANSYINERGLIELDSAILANQSCKVSKIVVTRKQQPAARVPQANLRNPHIFSFTPFVDPARTYGVRWNPAAR